MRAKRERITYPVWDERYIKWSSKFIKQNMWRCDKIHAFEDLMQDAFLTFQKIKDTYPRIIEGAHFMALFKRAMINKMHDRSSYKQRHDNVISDVDADVYENILSAMVGSYHGGDLQLLLDELPIEMRIMLQEAIRPVKKLPLKGGVVKGTTNKRKNHFALGLNKHSDDVLLKELRTILAT